MFYMNKISKRINNLLYALIYQIVIIPLLGYITYVVYDKIAFLNVVQESSIIFYLLIILLMAFNVVCVYGVAYLYTKVYKSKLSYYTVVGMFTLFIALWVKVYYYVLENFTCGEFISSRCLDAFKYNKVATTILIILVAYYFVYHVLHIMLEKKKSDKGEKKQ